jgi:hypothetical protein
LAAASANDEKEKQVPVFPPFPVFSVFKWADYPPRMASERKACD